MLIQSGLYAAVRVMQYDFPQSNYDFYAMLERYNSETCTFFTPVGEMGFSLHEMYEVSELAMGDIPYEEYIPSANELHLMKKNATLVHEIYW